MSEGKRKWSKSEIAGGLAGVAIVMAVGGGLYSMVMPDEDGMTMSEREQYNRELLQDEAIESLGEKGWTVSPVEIPEEFNALSKGVYEVTMPTEDGPRDCVATVIRTTHGIKNTVFACH